MVVQILLQHNTSLCASNSTKTLRTHLFVSLKHYTRRLSASWVIGQIYMLLPGPAHRIAQHSAQHLCASSSMCASIYICKCTAGAMRCVTPMPSANEIICRRFVVCRAVSRHQVKRACTTRHTPSLHPICWSRRQIFKHILPRPVGTRTIWVVWGILHGASHIYAECS